MSENKSFDDKDQQLPSSLMVSKFSAARCKEIQIMKSILSNTSGTKLAFQKLPRHMRRRVMSHNAKRLPRRLREIHLNQMKKSGLLAQPKRPSRNYRRKSYNLMSDHTRRQKKYKWLDTHLWHAKRFHMVEKWGYKLPFRSCDRAFKACYRATVNHCLLQDISYYKCIEIVGDYEIVTEYLKKLSDACLGLTVTAKSFAKGSREGSTTLFSIDDSKKAIGTIYFNWKPSMVHNKRVLWIWIHAAYYNEALNTLISCFSLKIASKEANSSGEGKYYTDSKNIELNELNLNRFRLTGPLSNSVLQNCFHLSENNENIVKWTKNYNENVPDQIQCQSEYWANIKNISSVSDLSPHMILSLIVEDPRLYLPKKRTKSLLGIVPSKCIHPLPENLAEGPIWDEALRKASMEMKPSNATLAEKRKNLLVPGSDIEEKGVPVPIMLIQRPGKKNQQNVGYSSGWDIIIPSGWAQPIWISLIMWGAKPGGLKETNSINFEMNQPNLLYPDTTAGAEEEHSISNKCKEVYFKLPSNKRTNYNKFRITSPFEWKWNLLLSDWNESNGVAKDFFVLRDLRQLQNIQDSLSSKSKNVGLPKCLYNCLIPVSIQFTGKGICNKFAIICLPKEGDLKKVPAEANCSDKNEHLRKELRKEHKVLLKRLRQRRVRAKKNGKVIPVDMTMLNNYKDKMKALWLPQATTIRHSCSREVIGFVRDGDFSFLLGQSKAIGYIAMSAIPTLLSLKSKNRILVRSTNSKQYRLGILHVVI